jgi:hypothetical protein
MKSVKNLKLLFYHVEIAIFFVRFRADETRTSIMNAVKIIWKEQFNNNLMHKKENAYEKWIYKGEWRAAEGKWNDSLHYLTESTRGDDNKWWNKRKLFRLS